MNPSQKNKLIKFSLLLFVIMLILNSAIRSIFTLSFARINPSISKSFSISLEHEDVTATSIATEYEQEFIEIAEAIDLADEVRIAKRMPIDEAALEPNPEPNDYETQSAEYYEDGNYKELNFPNIKNLSITTIYSDIIIRSDDSFSNPLTLSFFSDVSDNYSIQTIEKDTLKIDEFLFTTDNPSDVLEIIINPETCNISDISIYTTNGNINVYDTEGKNLSIDIVNADCFLNNLEFENITVSSTSRGICAYDLKELKTAIFSTVSGNIYIDDIETKNFELSSASGDISAYSVSAKSVSSRSVSGMQDFYFEYLDKAELNLNTISGSINCTFSDDQKINHVGGNVSRSDVPYDKKSNCNVKTSTVSGQIYFYR